MALAVWQGVVVDTDGAIIPNAEVAVVVEATGLDADLFTDVDGTTPTANPVFSDSEGFVRFYVAPGTYRITFTGVSGNRILRHVSIAGLDADDQRWTGANLWPANAITLTGSATLSPGESTIILNAASGTATIPSGLPVGTEIEFVKIHASAGTWTGARSDAETFGGATSFTITNQYERQVWTKVTTTRWERKLWSMGAQEYEPGTWNPEFQSVSGAFGPITYTGLTYGEYRIIGDVLYFWLSVQTDSIDVGTASGQVRITLPLTSAATPSRQGVDGVWSNAFGGDHPTSGLIPAGTAVIDLYYRTSVNGGVTGLDVSDLGTGASANAIRITGKYILA